MERYIRFLNVFEKVCEGREYCIKNNSKDINQIEKEYIEIGNFKTTFELSILNEIEEFNKQYEFSFKEIINDFIHFIKKINMEVKIF